MSLSRAQWKEQSYDPATAPVPGGKEGTRPAASCPLPQQVTEHRSSPACVTRQMPDTWVTHQKIHRVLFLSTWQLWRSLSGIHKCHVDFFNELINLLCEKFRHNCFTFNNILPPAAVQSDVTVRDTWLVLISTTTAFSKAGQPVFLSDPSEVNYIVEHCSSRPQLWNSLTVIRVSVCKKPALIWWLIDIEMNQVNLLSS